MRFNPLPLIVIAAPLAEIVVFGLVVQWIGFWSAFGLLMLTSLMGLMIVRHQGSGLMAKVRDLARNGRPPAGGVGKDFLTLLAGLLLLAPGFLTDLLGLLLLIPFVRNRLAGKAVSRTRVYAAGVYTERYEFSDRTSAPDDPDLVDLDEGEYRREEDDRSMPGRKEIPPR